MNRDSEALRSAMAGRRLFITGGSGFIGRNLIRHYLASGASVIALARSDKAEHTIRACGAVAVRGDLGQSDLAKAMSGCDLLIHAAADTAHGYQSAQQWLVNVEGTRNLFAAAKRAGMGKAVHISTESVLLTGKPLVMVDERAAFPGKFIGAYSHSKAAAEQEALKQAEGTFDVTIVRPRFVWGNDDTTALPQLTAAVRSGKFAWIAGGRYLTSTTHIDNLCEGVSRAAEFGQNKAVYFISDGEPRPFRDFVTQLLATQQLTAPDKSVPRLLVKAIAAAGDLAFFLSRGRVTLPLNRQTYATSAVEVTLNIHKARSELNYRPVKTVEQGLAEMSERTS